MLIRNLLYSCTRILSFLFLSFLHYKTIIFPIIGYPVFRDTVIYKKFSCYKKGELNRTPNLLKDLSYTYYTVEQINRKINRNV